MTHRSFSIVAKDDRFGLAITTTYEKSNKGNKHIIYGYFSAKAANNDIERLIDHFDSRKHVKSFISIYGKPQKTDFKRVRNDLSGALSGCIKKSRRKVSNKAYNLYVKNLKLASMEPLDRSEWDKIYDERDPLLKARLLRANARNPRIRTMYLIQGLNSEDLGDSQKAVTNAVNYVKERIKTLAYFIMSSGKLLTLIRKHTFEGTSYKLLLRAKFDEDEADDNVIDLTEDDAFTEMNTSKAQIARVIMQSIVVGTILELLIKRAENETRFLQNELEEIKYCNCPIALRLILADNLMKLKEFKERSSMNVITEKAVTQTIKKVPAKTARKWFNDFKEHKLFKEDLRGCYQRRFFLDEYGYKRRFELYLKNERHLSVDSAKKNLEEIMESDPPLSEEGKRIFASMLPLSRNTVHRWMLKCGCKYEKATVSYYTDSHEAEETKKDFRDR